MVRQRNSKRWLAVAGGLGVAAAAYWISSELATGGLDTADQTSSVVAAFAALISLALAAFPLLSPRSSERTNTSRELLAEQLAEQVRALSVREQEHWRTGDPRPLPVQWRTASEELFDRWENIHGAAEGADHGPVPLAGDFTRILRTYAAVPAQRLIILGKAGAGKTALAQHLILALLAENDRARPVPVLFSLNSWDASSVRLRDWMIHQLVRDYPFLDELDPTGRSGAEVLVDGDRVLPVLDAFDEIPQRHHREAVGEISRLDGPLVVTTRPGEYAEAVLDKNVIGRAAAIELDDVGLDEAERYLRASTGKTRAAEWAAVFDHLRTAPDDPATRNLAPALSTPLMTMLARATYNDIPEHHPGELLDVDGLPTREAVEQHLLGAFLHASYDPRRRTGRNETVQAKWTPERARHWLGHLATHLIGRDTHDLTWWQAITRHVAPPHPHPRHHDHSGACGRPDRAPAGIRGRTPVRVSGRARGRIHGRDPQREGLSSARTRTTAAADAARCPAFLGALQEGRVGTGHRIRVRDPDRDSGRSHLRADGQDRARVRVRSRLRARVRGLVRDHEHRRIRARRESRPARCRTPVAAVGH